MLYFGILAAELNIEILTYLPTSLLISVDNIRKLVGTKERYIFDLPFFQVYNTEVLWKKLYNLHYSIIKPRNMTYKNAFIILMSHKIKKKTDYLHYAAQNGLEQIIKKHIDNSYGDDFSYDYSDMLQEASIFLQHHIVKLLFSRFIFDTETRTGALRLLLLNNYPMQRASREENMEKLERMSITIDLLCQKDIIFPKILCVESDIILCGLIVNSILFINISPDYIEFLLKYNAIPDHQRFFNICCSLASNEVADYVLQTLRWCLEHMNVIITSEMFDKLNSSNKVVSLLVEKGYKLTYMDVQRSKDKSNFDFLLNLYIKRRVNEKEVIIQGETHKTE
jgi:hypothetical protein